MLWEKTKSNTNLKTNILSYCKRFHLIFSKFFYLEQSKVGFKALIIAAINYVELEDLDVQLCVVILGPPWRPPKCQAIWRKERSFKVTRRPVWVSRSRRRNVSDVLGQLEFGIRQKFGENFCWLLTKWKKNSTLFENFWRDDLQQLRVCRLHWPAKNIFICCNSAKFAVISKQTATAAVSSVFREIDRVVKSKKVSLFLKEKFAIIIITTTLNESR